MVLGSDSKRMDHTSSSEVCSNRYDVICSETARKIVGVVGKQTYGEKSDRIASLYTRVFIDEFPIASSQRKELQEFFRNNEVKAISNQILSKIAIQQTDGNKALIRSFLEGPDGKYNGDKFIQYVLQELGAYPFVVDIDLLD